MLYLHATGGLCVYFWYRCRGLHKPPPPPPPPRLISSGGVTSTPSRLSPIFCLEGFISLRCDSRFAHPPSIPPLARYPIHTATHRPSLLPPFLYIPWNVMASNSGHGSSLSTVDNSRPNAVSDTNTTVISNALTSVTVSLVSNSPQCAACRESALTILFFFFSFLPCRDKT